VLIGLILVATIIGRILLPMVMVMVILMVVPPTTIALEVMLKDFISKQTAFNKSIEEKFGKIDDLASKVDSLALDVELLKLKVFPHDAKESKTLNAIQVKIDDSVRMLAELHARLEREDEIARNMTKVCTITTTSDVVSNAITPPTLIGVEKIPTPCAKLPKTTETFFY
jgi:hypothetical protein